MIWAEPYSIQIEEDAKADFHADLDFPLRVFLTDLSDKPNGINNWHWHDELQFILVLNGRMEFHAGEKVWQLPIGSGAFVGSGILHKSISRSENPARYLCINLHPALFQRCLTPGLRRKYGSSTFNAALNLEPAVDWQKEILDHQLTIGKIARHMENGYELEILGHLFSMWKILVNRKEFSTQEDAHKHSSSQDIKKLLQYMHVHYCEEITLTTLAELIHRTRSSCCHLFRSFMGCTIQDYITQLRLQRSLQLLQETDLSVTEIAGECGFSGVSYFCERFKQYIGVTPLQYRKNYR